MHPDERDQALSEEVTPWRPRTQLARSSSVASLPPPNAKLRIYAASVFSFPCVFCFSHLSPSGVSSPPLTKTRACTHTRPPAINACVHLATLAPASTLGQSDACGVPCRPKYRTAVAWRSSLSFLPLRKHLLPRIVQTAKENATGADHAFRGGLVAEASLLLLLLHVHTPAWRTTRKQAGFGGGTRTTCCQSAHHETTNTLKIPNRVPASESSNVQILRLIRSRNLTRKSAGCWLQHLDHNSSDTHAGQVSLKKFGVRSPSRSGIKRLPESVFPPPSCLDY